MNANATNPVTALLEGYKAAVHAKDADAFAALYDANVRVFDMWGEWSCEGIDAWRAMAVGWFQSLASERVIVGVDDLRMELADDLATAQAFLTYTAVSAEGRELRSMNNRLTLVARRKEGAWKIVHEHTSAPADFSTSKLLLRRAPR